LRRKKKEKEELEKKLKRQQKKIKKRAEITKERVKIDPAYVDYKTQSDNEFFFENEISTSITKINCALETLIEKLKTEVKEGIVISFNPHKEMLSAAKDITKKVETVDQFLSRAGDSEVEEDQDFQDIIYYPPQTSSEATLVASGPKKRFKCLKCKKIFVLYLDDDETDMKKKLMECYNVDKVFINKHYKKCRL
jgi:hypothetical protein